MCGALYGYIAESHIISVRVEPGMHNIIRVYKGHILHLYMLSCMHQCYT